MGNIGCTRIYKSLCFIAILVVWVIGFTGCNPSSVDELTAEQPPTTQTEEIEPPAPFIPEPSEPAERVALPEKPITEPPGPNLTVNPGETIAIRAAAVGAMEYDWVLVGEGQIAGAGEAVLFTASKIDGSVSILTVTAANASGASPSTSLTIKVGLTIVPVRLDSLGIPAGFMSGRENPGSYITMGASDISCQSGTECLKVTYKSGGVWGGVYWWPSGCGATGDDETWRNVKAGLCGVDILQAGNLSAVRKLTFWARGKTGKEVVEFKVGAVDIDPSPGRSTGKKTLGDTWQKYEIILEGVDLTNAIALFGWIVADMENPEGAIFYLDDVQFESEK